MGEREIVLVERERMYALSRSSEGSLFLEVACGTFALEDLVVPLSEEEVDCYRVEGKTFLDAMAYKVCANRSTYQIRLMP